MPTISYEIEIIDRKELILNPGLFKQVQDIYNGVWKQPDTLDPYCIVPSCLRNEYNFFLGVNFGYYNFSNRPDCTVLLIKNGKYNGMGTLLFDHNTVTVENICTIERRAADHVQYVRSVISDLIEGPKYNILPFMQSQNSMIGEEIYNDFYMIFYIDRRSDSYNHFRRIYAIIEIENIGFVLNFITEAGGYDKTKFPLLNMKWIYDEAFVLRIQNNKILKRYDDYAITQNDIITDITQSLSSISL